MPKEKEKNIRQKKGELDIKTLVEKYGNDTAPRFGEMIKSMLSMPNPNAPVKIPKR
jgi:hypothetical protein